MNVEKIKKLKKLMQHGHNKGGQETFTHGEIHAQEEEAC